MIELPASVDVVDSHTEGEPTRVVIAGWPLPDGKTLLDRSATLAREHDAIRRAVVCEPRGHDAVVGALLTPPERVGSAAGVIFFNNVGTLGMCGHGMLGVVRTLEYLGRVSAGRVLVDTPVGAVAAELEADGSVTIQNVPATCTALDVSVDVPGLGSIRGDVAWGGNWFFITDLPRPELRLESLVELTDVTMRIRAALAGAGVRGTHGAEIDHIEIVHAVPGTGDSYRNFVLCPGLAYDRSPCGTGTSAKLAVLAKRGRIGADTVIHVESVTGGRFDAWLSDRDGVLVPNIRGRAFVVARSTLLFDRADPLRSGFTTV